MTSKMLDQRYSDNDQSNRDIPSFIEPMPPLISNPFMRPRPQKGTNLLELFEEDSESEEPELVQVYLRLKPYHTPNNLYEVKSDRCLITSVDTATAGHGRRTQHNVSKMYTFSHIFGPGSTQKEIFENVVKENLKKLPEGHNFTLLTYGASGSGKTYTLMGTVNSPGLVPRSLEYVFRVVDAAQQPLYKPADGLSEKLSHAEQDYELQWVKRLRHISAPLRDKYRRMSAGLCTDLTQSSMDLTNRTRHYVWVSFVEIYNEGIYDLLAPGDRRTASKLRIREDATGNVYVKDVTQAFVRTGEEAYDVMVAGKHNLQVAATGVHAHSSRSHCIFTITMLTETEGGVRASCVRLCDLAGCERARATRNTGARMAESRAINSSLHVLERCLHTLRRRQRRAALSTCVPYRESKLTRLLGAGLSGARGEAVSMVVTLNPAPQYAHETKHVLQLAAVARDIQVNNTIAESTLESSSQDAALDSGAAALRLRADNERLHFELLQAQSRNKELAAAMEERQQEAAATMRELVEEAKDMTMQYYVAQLEALRSEMEDMIEEYESRLQLQSKPALPALGGSGTPSRSLQNKVAQLMTEIAILEEKLTAESLARARAEEEVQHLRACIEERDDKEVNSPEKEDVMLLSDSDHSDGEVDPCNESLEPTFKKEDINRSRLIAQKTFDQSMTRDKTLDESALDNTVENDDEDQDSDTNKTDGTVKDHDNTETAKESEYVTGEDDTASTNKTTEMHDSAANETKNVGQITEFDLKSEKFFNKMSDITDEFSHLGDIPAEREQFFDKTANVTQDFSHVRELPAEREQFFDKTNAVDDSEFFDKDKSESQSMYVDGYSDFEVVKIKSNSASRGTYFISNNKVVEDIVKNNSNIQMDVKKSDSLTRGTYFVKDSQCDLIPLANAGNNNDDDTGIEMNSPVDKFVKPATEASETLANKMLKPLKMSNGNNTSLAQFEQLEIDSKNYDDMQAMKKIGESFGSIKMLKEKRTYFDKPNVKESLPKPIEEVEQLIPTPKIIKEKKSFFIETSSKEPVAKNTDVTEKLITTPKVIKGKKTFFDNINVNIEPVADKKVTDITKEVNLQIDDTRSPSIVKDEVTNDFKPSAITKLLGESFSRQPEISSVHINKKLCKKPDSIDIFEGLDSPHLPVKTTQKVDVVENARLSIEKMVLLQQSKRKVKQEFKLEQESIAVESTVIHPAPIANAPSMKITEKIVNKIHTESKNSKPLVTENDKSQNESVKVNNTIEEFENLCKDITTSRATEFEMLVSHNITTNKNEERFDGPSSSFEETKYNLRHKTHSKADGVKFADKVEKAEFEEVVLESYAKCESVKAKPTKRSLRLRKRRNHPDDLSMEEAGDKLKDIVNLQKEFSDVTMDVPAPMKEMRDIPSSEKVAGEDENLPPMLGIQSCPSKSVTRSRRKLFTPRAEPLDESQTGTADSNERVYVPRPSYHRARARRKL